MARITQQSEQLIIPAGTPAGQKEFRRALNPQYDRAIGYAIYVNSEPGVPVRASLRDDNDTYQQFTNVQDYIATINVAKSERYTKANIRAKGNFVTITLDILAPTTAELNYDFVFQLERAD